MKSNYLKLNLKDVVKSIMVTIITAVLTGLYQVIQSGGMLDWITIKPILIAGFGAGLSYLIKNFLTNSNDDLLKKE
jgi:hypothetical protein